MEDKETISRMIIELGISFGSFILRCFDCTQIHEIDRKWLAEQFFYRQIWCARTSFTSNRIITFPYMFEEYLENLDATTFNEMCEMHKSCYF